MEALRYAKHSEGGRRAYLENPSRLQAGEAMPTLLQLGKAQGHRRRDSKTVGRWIHQGSTPPRVVSKSRSCTKEEREMEDVCRLHGSQQDMPKGPISFAMHRPNSRFYLRVRNPLLP